MAKHIKVRITGRVQGVFFRENTRELAVRQSIGGFVRNERDGSVYIEAEGDSADLKVFTDYLHEGPPMARVDNVEITEGELKEYAGFRIEF
jgi:acylphosphatase